MSARSSPSASAPRARPISLTTACASGATAIQLGVEAIRRGETKASLCIGTDCSVTAEAVIRFSLLSALSNANEVPEEAAKPFSKNRDGFVIAEGSAALVLEDYDSARRARRRDPGGHPRRRREIRRFPPHPVEARRIGDHHRAAEHLRGRRHEAGRDRVHQRPRHRHARERQDGGDVAGEGLRRAPARRADLARTNR